MPHRGRTSPLLAAMLVVAASVAIAGAARAQDTPTAGPEVFVLPAYPLPAAPPALLPILSRAGAYVERFAREFSAAVVEERYVQVASPWTGEPPHAPGEPELAWREGEGAQLHQRPGGPVDRRQLLSDFLLVQGAGQEWAGYRDVAAVNGRAVRDRADRVQRLFLSGKADDRQQLGRIAAESARHNLGSVYRTVNTPTYVLQVLQPRWQGHFTFSDAGNEAIDDDCCVVVAYRETGTPTFIGALDGHDVPMRGRLWIEPASGRVRRTTLEFEATRWTPRGCLEVRYCPQADLDVFVPAEMWEWYVALEDTRERETQTSYLQGLASYGKLRRFVVNTQEIVK